MSKQVSIPVASSQDSKIYDQLLRGDYVGMVVVECEMKEYPDGIARWTLVLDRCGSQVCPHAIED